MLIKGDMEIKKKTVKKKNKIKPTVRQIKAHDNMIENGANKSKALKSAGYSNAIASNPSKVIESEGFKQLCTRVGLTDELITSSLTDDIKAKPKQRKAELELGAKILGTGNMNKTQTETAITLTDIIGKLASSGTDSVTLNPADKGLDVLFTPVTSDTLPSGVDDTDSNDGIADNIDPER